MEAPPPLSAPPIASPTSAAPPPPTTTTTTSNYADSVDSSPRSRNTDSWDEPPYGPTTAAAAVPANTANTKLRLMCSYGGHIVPRPDNKQLCYVGGDTRIIVVDRHTSLADLHLRLSKTVLAGKPFSLKYQLPNEDLDSLISVTTDEDFDNMVDEYDRLNSSTNQNSRTSRLRLFLFPLNLDSETSSSIESLLENSSKSNDWFFNALNWNTPSCKSRTSLSETSSVNCLLGLDDAVENPAVKGNNNLNNNNSGDSNIVIKNNNSNVVQDVQSVPDSPMLETTSSFGSSSSSPSMANLPPIRVRSEEGNNPKGVVGLGIEEQFSQLNVPAPAPVQAVGGGLPVLFGGEYINRVFSDDERLEQGVAIGFRKVPQVQPQQQQVQQLHQQQQHLANQVQQNKPIGAVDIPSPDSVSSDGGLTNLSSRQKPVIYHEQIVQTQSANGRVLANQIDPKTSDLNSQVQMPQQVQEPGFMLPSQPQQVQESGYVLPSQFDQYQQLQQSQQFVPAGTQYIQHHHPGAVPMYYPMYPSQQLGHPSGLEHQYPVYFMPARPAQPYNLPVQQPSYTESTPAAPSSRPQTPPAPMVPPTAFNPATSAAAGPRPEMAAGMYRTSAAGAPHLVQIPSSQSPQYTGYSQVQHPSQSTAPPSAATANYAYEFADPAHAQIYYTQPLAPQLAAQHQTMTPTPR